MAASGASRILRLAFAGERLEDLDSAALTYAEVKAIASGNPLVIEKAQVDAELMRLTRLRSAHAEEQYRIRSNLRRSYEDAGMFTTRLTNLRQDLAVRQDTSGDKFIITLDGQETNNRGIAGELILRRAEKLKDRFGDDVRIGRFAGFDLFLRPSFNNTVEVVVRGKNSYAARVTGHRAGHDSLARNHGSRLRGARRQVGSRHS